MKKVDKPVKNIASTPRRSIQRETGNVSGAASGHSRGGSTPSSASGHSQGGNRQASGSTGNKAGSMAAVDTGKLAGMSGVIGRQRPGYKEQMARMRMERSKRVTCAAGQKNASAMANAGVWSPDMTQELWQLFPLLTPEMLALLAALAPWIALFAAGVMVAVYMPTVTHQIKPTKHENDSKALKGDVLDANGRVIAKAGGGAPNPNRNNKKLAKDILRTAVQTKNVLDSLEKVGEVAEKVGQAGSGNMIGELAQLDKQGYKHYSAGYIEKKYGLKKGQYHREIKPQIISDLSSGNSPYKKEMRKMGNNPDIYLSEDGRIQIVSTAYSGKSFETDWYITDYLP